MVIPLNKIFNKMSNNTNDNNLLTFLKNQSLFNQSPQRRMSSRSRDRKSGRGSPSPGHNQNMNYTSNYNQNYSNPINTQENYKNSSTIQGTPTNFNANLNLQGGIPSGNYQTTTTTAYNTTGGSALQGNTNFQGQSSLQNNSNIQGGINYQSQGGNLQSGNYQGGHSNIQGTTNYQTTSYQGGNYQGGLNIGLTGNPGNNFQGQYTTTTTTVNSADANLVTYSNSFESARV